MDIDTYFNNSLKEVVVTAGVWDCIAKDEAYRGGWKPLW